jgi:hypothetical protein
MKKIIAVLGLLAILLIPRTGSGWIGSSFVISLSSPVNLSTQKLYITLRGICYDTLNTIIHIYGQAYQDADGDGVIDPGESTWTTFSNTTDFSTTVNSNISADYAGTSSYFTADKKYWVRIYGLNSAGEASADPDVENILSGDGGWDSETDCYAYITIPAAGLKAGTRPTW